VFVDARSIADGTVLEADLCIIGAGAAGIALTRELIGTPIRVAVLESGDTTFDEATQELYAGPVVGLPYFPLDTARLRYFGGTTNHWGGVCRPFEAEDFEAKDWVPLSGWPIGKADLDPFYERARLVSQVNSGDWDLDDWLERDTDEPLPIPPDRVVTRVAQVVKKAARSFGTAYRNELERAANVTVYLRANATEIETDEPGTTATRVRVATLAGSGFSVAARRFVVAVGGIENPRLLLASNSRFPSGLGNGNDLVGRFFLEHPRFLGGMVMPADSHIPVDFYDDHHVVGTELEGYLSISRDILRSERLVDVQIRVTPTFVAPFVKSLDSDDVASLKTLIQATRGGTIDDFGRHLSNVVGDLLTWEQFAIPGSPIPVPYPEVVGRLMRSTPVEAQALIPDLLGDVAAASYAELYDAPVDSLALTPRIESAPDRDSRVSLTTERDPLGVPRAQLDWQLSELDRHSARRALEIVAAEFGRAGLGRVQITFDENTRDWPADLAGGWHHMGTTRMSDSPRTGVVDRDCRVHGFANLYVAGSSVFPTPGSGTPTLTIVALALRLADHLRESFG
jgi:choline dehydrogenase-like flavoprotein